MISMVKYRCVKADRLGGAYWEGRQYVEDGIQDARKRAMKMLHGDKTDSVLIWLESDFKNYPWIGFHEKVVVDKNDKSTYLAFNNKGTFILRSNGSAKEMVW